MDNTQIALAEKGSDVACVDDWWCGTGLRILLFVNTWLELDLRRTRSGDKNMGAACVSRFIIRLTHSFVIRPCTFSICVPFILGTHSWQPISCLELLIQLVCRRDVRFVTHARYLGS